MTCQIAAWHALVLLILGRMCLPNLPENGFRKKAKPLVLGCPSFVFLTHPQHWHALGVEDIPPSCILPRYVREVRQCPSAAPRTLCPWHGAAIISWALWSPRALAKASCSVGPVAWRTSLWCPDLADWGGLQGLMRLYRWLYTILINIDYTILYTIYYTHLYSFILSIPELPAVTDFAAGLAMFSAMDPNCLLSGGHCSAFAAQFGSEAETAEVRFCPCRSEDWVLASFMWLT